ncbi:MAG: Chromosome partition protein Smc [Gemmatimonadaceae bacterium]|nr:Chromosome partition protein Smc [Gemmatimonadaceae bacterium]
MRLTKLELLGFKSFADQTLLRFDPGVTAIVGPNGCGKSNVSDAVRWVLGEQRARMLRGAKMEEVIFQGSSARRAVNVAEVSLHFDNSDGTLPTPYREVVITRRLSRSGESDYLLNGALCRLRDIHDLVRGTGLGADSGVVIEARMIDALLSDRPDERRELFEEAAGVSLYRDRRRSTERRLEETTQDIARLDDLLSEVQSQVRSLSRQRKRAEKHSELMTRRFAVDLTLASREMQSWQEELAGLEDRLAALRAMMPEDEALVAAAATARDHAHEQRAAAEARRSELGRLTAVHSASVQELRGEIAVAEERHRNAEQRRQRADEERREGEAYEERLRQDRERAATERDLRQQELGALDIEGHAHRLEEESARQSVGDARLAVEAADRDARSIRDQARELELDRDRAQRETVEIVERLQALEEVRSSLTDAEHSLQREIASSDEAIGVARSRAAAATLVLEGARTTARDARARDAEARGELSQAVDAFTQIEARVHALEGLERERVGLAPAAARLLRERDRFGDGAVLGPLSDFVTADASAAALVERFLGMIVHAVVVRDAAAAHAIREWHHATNPGPLLLLPVDAVSDENGAAELLAPVQAAAPAERWIRTLLNRVRTLGDGGFIDARGAVWLPGSGGGPGPLRRRAELFALRGELSAAEANRRLLAENADRARADFVAAETEVSAAADAAAAAHDMDRRATDERAELERRRLRLVREREDAAALAERLRSRQIDLGRQLDHVEERVRELMDLAAQREQQAHQLRDVLAQAEGALEDARERRAAGQVAQAQAHARLQVALDRERRLDEEASGAATRLTSLRDELALLHQSDRALAEQMASWQADLTTRVATLADVQGHLALAETAVRDADRSLADAEEALERARRDAHEHEQSSYHAEVRFTELAGRRTAIRERLETEWRRPLDELLGTFEPVLLDDDSLRTESETLRNEVERLGPVNPLAIEEHDEEQKRLEFLTGQRNDLAEARSKLQVAIREIDVTARELFMATFTQVRENFRQIFMTLFGGGECDLRLESPDAPLDCDIEIHASPRGKRTQRIHLLSSGERALVALSLLFGIFLTKPSPFCLLDEVDAPLDDANIGRFVRMLNEFKANTQFIVITHNPRTTTEAADAVYGVTMQEPGVSSIVSVRMRGNAVDDPVEEDLGVSEVLSAPA